MLIPRVHDRARFSNVLPIGHLVRVMSGVLTPVIFLAACATNPQGPTVSVMPGKGKSTEVFAADNAICKQFAADQIEGRSQHANFMQVAESVGGTLLGAGIGAAFGGGRGAAMGAALGTAGGVGAGIYTTDKAQTSTQDRYNAAFIQCMQTRKNWTPVASFAR